MTTYNIYGDDGFYTKTVESDTPVPNSVAGVLPKASPGHTWWFDSIGWRQVPDVRAKGTSMEDARQQAYDMLSSVPSPRDYSLTYSQAELESFDAQYAEAQVVIAGGEGGVYLKALSKETGESVEDIALKVITKREEADAVKAEFAAKAQALRNRIKNAKTKAELPTFLDFTKLKDPF